jgi:hypothetical protein
MFILTRYEILFSGYSYAMFAMVLAIRFSRPLLNLMPPTAQSEDRLEKIARNNAIYNSQNNKKL